VCVRASCVRARVTMIGAHRWVSAPRSEEYPNSRVQAKAVASCGLDDVSARAYTDKDIIKTAILKFF